MPETQPEVLPATPMHVEEKIDGSLGIIFHHQGKWDVCTKGSFDSDQANYTREELLPKYLLEYVPTSLTLLCEIIYPENRIVIDYQERRELVLLTAFNSENGLESTRNILQQTANQIGMSLVREFSYSNILDLPFEENEEGYVVRFTGGLRVKIKSPDYVKVHRLLTYKSPKRMLELLQADQYDEIRRQIPEALVGDFDDLRASIKMSFLQVQNQAKQAFSEVQKFSSDRKTFALEVQSRFPKHMWSLMFGMLDGKNTDEMIFKIIKDTLKE